MGRPSTDALTGPTTVIAGCRLRVVEGRDIGREFLLKSGSCVVGTAPEADFRLRDTAVSGSHFRLTLERTGMRVSDLGSRNGTFYLGLRCSDVVIGYGATLSIGRSRVVLASPAPDPATTSTRDGYGGLIGSTPAMRRLYRILEQVEPLDIPVLIQGETGVGKGVVARAIHAASGRKSGPFEVLDCGAVAKTLLDSELFGHVRGAFTGADSDRAGVFVRADRGTVFLDELGELARDSQSRLLRALEDKRVRPLGSEADVVSDFRVIAATHRDLDEAVRNGEFREDLYFRLGVVSLVVPPLRERREDIPELVRHILRDLRHDDFSLSRDTLELFTSGYDWPGNVRELRHAIVSVVSVGMVPARMRSKSAKSDLTVDTTSPLVENKRRVVDAFEREYAVATLRAADNNIARAARLAGMDRSQFRRLLKKHALL